MLGTAELAIKNFVLKIKSNFPNVKLDAINNATGKDEFIVKTAATFHHTSKYRYPSNLILLLHRHRDLLKFWFEKTKNIDENKIDSRFSPKSCQTDQSSESHHGNCDVTPVKECILKTDPESSSSLKPFCNNDDNFKVTLTPDNEDRKLSSFQFSTPLISKTESLFGITGISPIDYKVPQVKKKSCLILSQSTMNIALPHLHWIAYQKRIKSSMLL